MFSFGSGVLQGFRTDVANATPINFGLVQEVDLSLDFDTKELYGQYQFPVAIARGKAKFTGKAKLARISGVALGTLFFGITPVAGQVATSFAETGTIPAVSGPYTITVSQSATYVDDLGVVNAVTGLPLTKVSSGPTSGQYSEAAGVYTFAAADTGIVVLISYTYTVTTGEKIVVTNQLLGTTPTFQSNLYTTFQGKAISVKVPNCVSSKLGFATKLDDFVMPDLEWDIFADAAGNVATWSFAEAA